MEPPREERGGGERTRFSFPWGLRKERRVNGGVSRGGGRKAKCEFYSSVSLVSYLPERKKGKKGREKRRRTLTRRTRKREGGEGGENGDAGSCLEGFLGEKERQAARHSRLREVRERKTKSPDFTIRCNLERKKCVVPGQGYPKEEKGGIERN